MASNPIGSASISWIDSGNNMNIHVYWTDGYTVNQRIWSGSSWSTGSFSQPGEQVSATVYQHNGVVSLRVYCTFEDAMTEWCQDGGAAWYQGGFTVS